MAKTSTLSLVCLALFAVTIQQSLAWDHPIKTRFDQCKESPLYVGSCDFEGPGKVIEYGCVSLRCAVEVWNPILNRTQYRRQYFRAPEDGTYCGPLSYCHKSRCVTVASKDEMPTYLGEEHKIEGCN